MWTLATSGARAHRGPFAGTALVLALAAVVVAVTGVLAESGVRTIGSGDPQAGGLLVALASSFAGTALVVVVLVVAATVSLALRGRRREFALLRAVGATPAQVRRAVVLEVLLVTAVAAPPGAVLGMIGARRLDPLLVEAGIVAPDFTSTWSALPVLLAVLVVLATAVPVGRLAARESARIAPTAALQLSAVEAREIGRGRRVGAATLTVLGLASAFSPLVVPGTIGGASAAVSAFLLIGAGALAGPVVVSWVFDRLARLHPAGGAPATLLAVSNVRGFSRRLTTVVVPLALVVAVATVQTSVDRAMVTAAHDQVVAALDADLVVATPAGLSPEDVDRIAGAPGVARVTPLAAAPAQVRTDDDELFAGALSWESAVLRVVPPTGTGAIDPGVVEGSLAGLDAADTVSVSTDAAFLGSSRLGGSLTVRLGDDEVDLEVVAVHTRGLGVGDLLVGPATTAAHGLDAPADVVLVGLVPGTDTGAVAATLVDALPSGAQITDVAGYAAAATATSGGDNALSTALLLLLLVVVAIGAATTLALTTASRRDEFALLHRTGTTRRQLTAMTTVESLITGLTALALGSLAVVPAVVGVSAGLLGARLPVLDVPTYLVAGGGVVLLAVAATGVASWRATRRQ